MYVPYGLQYTVSINLLILATGAYSYTYVARGFYRWPVRCIGEARALSGFRSGLARSTPGPVWPCIFTVPLYIPLNYNYSGNTPLIKLACDFKRNISHSRTGRGGYYGVLCGLSHSRTKVATTLGRGLQISLVVARPPPRAR